MNPIDRNPSAVATAVAPREEAAMRYAGFWRRFAAWIMDMALVTVGVVPIAFLLIWVMDALHGDLRMKQSHGQYLAGLISVFSWVIGDWLYNAYQLSSPRQATYGKRCLSLRVTTSRGRRVSFVQASARHFAKFLSAFIGFTGFLIAIFTRRHQALHDIVADTVVVEDGND